MIFMKQILIALLFIPQIVLADGITRGSEDTSRDCCDRGVPERSEIIISTSVYYTSNNTLSDAVKIVSGGQLSILATTTMTGNGLITVCNGGKLNISGTLDNANVVLQSGAQVLVSGGGKINLASGKTFDAPSGAVVDITCGEVNNY